LPSGISASPTVVACKGKAVAAGLADTKVDVLPFSEALTAHKRMESRDLDGRIVLIPDAECGIMTARGRIASRF
jgi:NADPH2:quinone reductase